MTAQHEMHENFSDQTCELTVTELDAAAGGWATMVGLSASLASQQRQTSTDHTLTCRKAGRDQQE